MDTLYVSANNNSIDVSLLAKSEALLRYADRRGIPLRKTAYIGDEVTDIGLLAMPGLGLAGAPANAQRRVKEVVATLPNGRVYRHDDFGAFCLFYGDAEAVHITDVVSDRDGVLVRGKDRSGGPVFKKLMKEAGINGYPRLAVLSGSGLDQQEEFVREFGLDEATLSGNKAIRADPYRLLLENGALEVNVLSINGTFNEDRIEMINHASGLNPGLLGVLLNELAPAVKSRVEREVLPGFGFVFSSAYNGQVGAVFVPKKRTMFTLNVPRCHADGRKFRETPDAEPYRTAVTGIVTEEADRLRLPYEVL